MQDIDLNNAGIFFHTVYDSLCQVHKQLPLVAGKGRLKLGINPILGSHTLYNILPEFITSYPGIEVELVEDNSDEMEILLLKRKIDICLNILPIFHPDIKYERLYEEKIYLVIPPGHKYYHADQKGITQLPFPIHHLNREKFILLKLELGLRRLTDAIFRKYSIEPTIVLETQNVENAFRLANSGVGLTIIPESCITRDNVQTESNYYMIGQPAYKNNVVAAYKKEDVLSAPALAFLNMAKMKYSN